MLCDADLKVSWRTRPQGFIALMTLYESNYLRFVHLVGDPRTLRGTLVSSVPSDCELLLNVIEHMPYTSTLEMTYLLPAVALDASVERQPDLRLRLYHDARLLVAEHWPIDRADAGAGAGEVGAAHSPPKERELHQRWQRNMLLNKWLEYCAERGHRFLR